MSSLYSKLSILKNDENFFPNSKKNGVIKQLQKELKLTLQETTIFSIIMSYQLNSTYAIEFLGIKDDFKLSDDTYLNYLNIAYKLEKKGLISITEKRRGRTSRLNPEFNIDDMIFNKLILGFDYLDEVDFSDIYSVVNVIEQLFQKKDDNKLTENRFYDEANRVFEKMEKNKEFTQIINKYSVNEKLILLHLVYEYIDGNNGERANSICETFFDNLSSRAKYLESILKSELDIFKDKLVKLEERSGFFDSSAHIELTPKAISLLLQSKDKTKKLEFKAHFTKHIKFNSLKKEIFLDERIAKDIKRRVRYFQR